MAPPAVKLRVDSNAPQRSVVVADGTAISAGTLMVFTAAAANTAVASTKTDNCRFAGIAAADKQASDGATRLGVYFEGVKFDVTISAAVLAGDYACISGANIAGGALSTSWLSGSVIGKFIENGAAGDVVAVELGVI